MGAYKTLEENNLKVSKALARLSAFSIFAQMSARSAVGGKGESFGAYMLPKTEQAAEQIEIAKSVDEIIQIIINFTNDCIHFTGALFK